MSSSLYYYTARNAEGQAVRGSLQASGGDAALASLRTRALFVTSLTSARSVTGVLTAGLQLGRIRHGALVAFFRSLATLISAGVPMRRALAIGVQQAGDSRLREALNAVSADVDLGMPLSRAMSKRPKEFSPPFVAMIRAGEAGGVLDEVLERLAQLTERERAIRKRLASALTYPAIVAVSAAGLILFLLSSIVPMFASLYEQLHVELPRATAILLVIGQSTRAPNIWLLVFAAAVPAALISALVMRSDWGQLFFDTNKLRIPIFGIILRKAAIARLMRMLGSLLKSGLDLVSAIDAASDVVGNRAYALSLVNVRRALREGEPLAPTLSQSDLYDPLVAQMITVGEETGTLDSMLLRVAEYYELDVETAVSALGSTLEPVLILALGGVVGFIVFSIFIPLYTLIGNIK